MIYNLGLRNFKCFTSTDIEFGRLNVLAGSNGTGKSTIVQALLVIFQSVQSGAINRKRLQLNGPLIELGTGRDVLYKRSDTDSFEILVGDETDDRNVIASVPASESKHILEILLAPPIYRLPWFDGQLQYLSADRLGPQKSYPMNLDDSLGNEIGRRGEFAPLLYSRSRSNKVLNKQILLENVEKQRFADVETQFNLWMGRLFPGFEARAESFDQLDTVMLGLNLQKQIGEPEFLRPSNVGFGVSVVFPIILTGLLAAKNSTLIVENPEAHLHPSAQSLVGEFLARVAAGGTQVFIETHSEHIVNGIRIAFKNKIITARDLRFLAFSKTEDYGSHHVDVVSLGEDGDFVARPDAFFDQIDKDLKLIYGL